MPEKRKKSIVPAKAPIAHRSDILFKMAKAYGDDDESGDLIVHEGETKVLSYASEEFKPFYQEVRLDSVDELKDLIGVPDTFVSPHLSAYHFSAMAGGPGSSPKTNKPITKFRARTISPDILTDRNAPVKEKEGILEFSRDVIKRFVYGNSEAYTQHRGLIDAYLKLKKAVITVPFFRDITVYPGGTLNIAANTFTVYARKIRLYGSGRIECDGPTTFDCTSFEGFLLMVAVMQDVKLTRINK